MPQFNPGDKVVWSHEHGALHGQGSVLKRSAVEATSKDEFEFGEIVRVANVEETWFDVALEGGEARTLTGDELVLVSTEE